MFLLIVRLAQKLSHPHLLQIIGDGSDPFSPSPLKLYPFNKVIMACRTERSYILCTAMSWVSDYEDRAASSSATQGGHGLVI